MPIGQEVFYECINLKSVYYEGTINDWMNFNFVDEYANPMYYAKEFYLINEDGEAELLTELIISNEITNINDYTFYGFENLINITIPSSITNIGKSVFFNCENIEQLYYDGTIDDWVGINFSDTYANPIYYANEMYCKNDLNVYELIVKPKLSTKVSCINSYSFVGYKKLIQITIPHTVEIICTSAFNECTQLEKVIFEWGIINNNGDTTNSEPRLEIIESYAFSSCKNLTSFTLPSNVAFIEYDAFIYCDSLREIINNSSLNIVKGSNNNGYIAYYAIEVKNYNLLNTTEIDDFVFYETEDNVYLIKYIGNNHQVVLPDSFEGRPYIIYTNAFYNNQNIFSITIPANVTEIMENAFVNCNKLVEVINLGSLPIKLNNYAYGNVASNAIVIKTEASSSISYYNDYIYLEDILYIEENKHAYLIEYVGSDINLELPTTLNGLNYEIYNYAFAYNKNIQSVVIPSTVNRIGKCAFSYCKNLVSINIPSNVSILEDSVFSNCENLKEVKIAENCNITVIDDYAFYNCKSVSNFIIPSSVSQIYDYAFGICNSLTKITIPAKVKKLNTGTFSNCINLDTVIFEDGSNLLELDWHVFDGCKKLEHMEIPSTVTNINPYCFKGCESLKKITLPKNLKYIHSYTFANCFSLTDVFIPDQIDTIDDHAFANCINLQQVNLPYGILDIKHFAFSNCQNLKTIIIPSSVTHLGESVFANCFSLTNVIFEGNSNLQSIDYKVFEYCSSLSSIVIPSSVNTLGTKVFSECNNLKTIVFEKGTKLQKYYFNSLPKSIENIYFGSSIEKWLNINFMEGYCDEFSYNLYFLNSLNEFELLKELVIPNGFENIKNYAFYNCKSLTSVSIPLSVTIIGKNAFNNCINLTSVIFDETSKLKNIDDNAFSGCVKLCNINIPRHLTRIGDNAFYNCKSIKEVTLPNTLEYLGSNAFYMCLKLNNVELDVNTPLQTINNGTFYNCINLKYIVIPSSVVSINNYAFYQCTSLQQVYINEDSQLNLIGGYTFQTCYNLKSIIIPTNVTKIGSQAFHGCSSLIELVNNSSLTISKYSSSNGYAGYYTYEIKQNTQSSVVVENDFIFYETDEINYLIGYLGNELQIVLPDDYKGQQYEIFTKAFYYNKNIVSITISQGVSKIKGLMFNDTCRLVEVINNSSLDLESGSSTSDKYFNDNVLRLKNIDESTVELIDDYIFYEYDGVVYLVGYVGNDVDLVLPNDYHGKPYVIKTNAFREDKTIYSIKIPSSVIRIEKNTFTDCRKLNYIYYNGTIDQWLNLSVGDSELNEKISNLHFYLKDHHDLYYDASSINELIIPDGMTTIGANKLFMFKNLRYVSIPASVTTLEDYSFAYCKNLVQLDIDENSQLTFIGSYAFFECEKLLNINIPSTVTTIKNGAFAYCKSLINITIPSTISELEDYTFLYCKNMINITIPSSVIKIGYDAFNRMESLKTVYYDGTIEDWLNLKFDYVSCTPMAYADTIFMKNEQNDYYEVKEIIIPDTIKSIKKYQFYGFNNLESVILSSKLVKIEKWAFYECAKLTTIYIPANVQYIEEEAFKTCDNLTIYCEAMSKPYGWKSSWNIDNRPVVWNYKINN